MGAVVYVDFELRNALRTALEARRASVEAYGSALRARAPRNVILVLAVWCRTTNRQLRAVEDRLLV